MAEANCREKHPACFAEAPEGPPEGPLESPLESPPEGQEPKWVGPRWAQVDGPHMGGPTPGPSGWAQAGPKPRPKLVFDMPQARAWARAWGMSKTSC